MAWDDSGNVNYQEFAILIPQAVEVKEESQDELWLILKKRIINKQFGARATHQEVVTEWEIDFISWFEKEIESKFIIKRMI